METTQENKLIKIDATEFGIEQSKANVILAAFEPSQVKMAELEPEYLEVIALPLEDPMTELKAADLLKKYVKIRTGRNAVHKQEKDFFLNAGRFVDKIKNLGNAETEKREEKLEAIKNHYANLEKSRIAALAASRNERLKQFDFDGSQMNLGTMEENVWVSFLAGTELSYNQKKAEEQRLAEEKAAKEKAEAEERERVAKENERLKAEAAEREKQLAAEREKARKEQERLEAIRAAEQKKADELLEAQRKAAEAKAKKEKEIADAKLKAEREAKEKLEAELRAKQEAERKAEEAKQAEIKAQKAAEAKAAKAPDKNKLAAYIESFSSLPIPDLKTNEASIISNEIQAKVLAFKKWAHEQINTL
jgi:hypothetical protein